MNKSCYRCHNFIRDEEEIVAVVRTVFHQVASRVSYAIETPTECLKMYHVGCTEWGEEEFNDDTEII